MKKLMNLVKRQLAWQKLPELDQQIIRVEQDLIESYVRWQELLAARDAKREAQQNVNLMIRDVYQKHQFEY